MINPFIKVEVSNELTACFTKEGEAVIKDIEGNPISEGALSDLLFEYRVSEEEKETVSLGDWEIKIGELSEEKIKIKPGQ